MVLGYQGSWATSVGLNLNFDVDELVPEPSGFNLRRTGVRLDLSDSDNNKVTYISPRFGGFQIGGSYARDVGSGINADAEVAQPVSTTSAEDWYSIAANFDRKFGNFRIGVAVGYVDDEVSVLWLTHAMTLGPGVTWKNTLAYADWDGEEAGVALRDNDGWGAATTIALSF